MDFDIDIDYIQVVLKGKFIDVDLAFCVDRKAVVVIF
jgi:hypothetical protein